MAVSVDASNVSNSGGGATITSITWSHTVATNTNQILLVMPYTRDNSSSTDLVATGVTFNGDALTHIRSRTQAGDGGEYIRTGFWGRLAPTATTANVVVTLTASTTYGGAKAFCLIDAKQSLTPNVSNDGGQTNYATSDPSVAVTTTVANCIVIDATFNETGSALNIGANQTSIGSNFDPTSGANDTAASSYETATSTGTYTMTWSTAADDNKWVEVVIAMETAASALSIDVNDSITLSESSTILEKSYINVSDSVTITENSDVSKRLYIDKSESIAVSESSTVGIKKYVNVSDDITVTEDSTVLIPKLYVDISDDITTSESSTILINELYIDVSDDITVTDSSDVGNDKTISVYEDISLSENISIVIPTLYVDVNDIIPVTEISDIVGRILSINLNDTISVSESNSQIIIGGWFDVNDEATSWDTASDTSTTWSEVSDVTTNWELIDTEPD